jgi:nicotinamidase-related amidase
MRKVIFIFFALIPSLLQAQTNSKTALLLIDIQDFYFPGGNSALVEPEAAAEKAALVLADFRSKNQLVIHVRHDYEPGGDIHVSVKPLESEKIITKKEVNSFKDTDLLAYLK